MKITLTLLMSFILLISISVYITNKHKSEYSVEFCSKNEEICVNTENGKTSTKLNLNINDLNTLTFEQEGNRIDCAVRSGRIIFNDVCTKSYLINIIKTGNIKNINLIVAEWGTSLNIEPVLNFFMRIQILKAEALLLLTLDVINGIMAFITGLLRI